MSLFAPATLTPRPVPVHAPITGSPEELAVRYAPLVKYVVGRLGAVVPGVFDHQDAVQAGTIGLLQALHSYRPDAGASFETFAFQRIRGAILDAVREIDPLGRAARDDARTIERTMTALELELGRRPDETEVAERMGVTVERYRRKLEAATVTTVPLDEPEPRFEGGDAPVSERLIDTSATDPEEAAERADLLRRMATAIGTMPERHQLVVSLYYTRGLTFREIGEVLGLTESRACQIHTEAVLLLRSQLLDPDAIERLRSRGRGGRRK